MPRTPIVFETTHRIRFSEIDAYHHVGTASYATYFIDHRMQGLRERLGWDLEALAESPFAVWVRRMEIDFLRPAQAGQEITITSFVREFSGPDVFIECTMADADGRTLSRCQMTVAHVDKATQRACDWPPERMALFFEPEEA